MELTTTTVNQAIQAVDYFTKHNVDIRPSSKGTYNRVIKLFFEWVAEQGKQLCELQREDVAIWKQSLLDAGRTASTVALYLTTLRNFYSWVEIEGLGVNIAKGIKTPKKSKGFKKMHLTDEKAGELLQYFNTKSLRDYAIVNLMLRTGLRTCEIVRANIEDVQYKGGQRILRVLGKGRDTREDFVILTDKAFLPIARYLQTRHDVSAKAPLFISSSNYHGGERLSTRRISKICKCGLKAINLDAREFTAHSLRHTTAVSLLEAGVGIESIQEVLRHQDVKTTQIYIESVKEARRLRMPAEAVLDSRF